jgi:hypothetical protein
MADIEVLIAGAGPTGLTLAVCLRRYRSLEPAYPEWLRGWVVTPEARRAGAGVLVGTQGQAHRRFGAGTPCVYLVRPDKYVGARLRPVEPNAVRDELRARLGLPR